MFDFTRLKGSAGGLSGFLAAALLALAGCSGSYPNAVAFNRDLPEEADDGVPGRSNQQLTGREKSEAERAMQSVAAGHTVVERPAAASRGVRWSEIPRAVNWAGGRDGVELVVTGIDESPDEYRFELRTIENWPGALVIVRGEGARVYEVESVWVGRFPDEPEHVQRARLLVSEFEARLRVLGARKK